MDEELVQLLGKLMAGLSVPGAMGLLGTAREPWGKLRDRWHLFGYQTGDEIAVEIRKHEGVIVTVKK